LDGTVIETRDLVKVFREGKVRAVDGLSLNIKKGEIYALIGANGSGKSTTINMMTGALAPTSGSINVLGLEVPRHRHQVAARIGVAPQEYSVYSDLTLEQNVRFFARLYGMKEQDFRTRFRELAEILRLQGRENTVVANLSGGLKRRASIMCALIHEPEIVFFDEATVGIDPVLRAFFWQYFRSLTARGLTILLTSHVMDEAGRADRIGLVRAGKLIDEGEPQSLMARNEAQSIEEVFLKLSEKEFNDE
jgi:ABC-2 type transport system ATP-binding protein